MKKLLSLFCALMLVCASASSASAARQRRSRPVTSGDYEYMVQDDGTAMITRFTGSPAELAVPAELDGVPVASIDYSVFYNIRGLTSVSIPGSVRLIGESAFFRCADLASVSMQDGVTSISERAFGDCTSLTEIVLPDSVVFIGENAPRSHPSAFPMASPSSATVPLPPALPLLLCSFPTASP